MLTTGSQKFIFNWRYGYKDIDLWDTDMYTKELWFPPWEVEFIIYLKFTYNWKIFCVLITLQN